MGHDPPHDQQEGRPPPHPMTARTPARNPASAPSTPECAPWPTRSPGPPTGRNSPRPARPETPPPATRHAPAHTGRSPTVQTHSATVPRGSTLRCCLAWLRTAPQPRRPHAHRVGMSGPPIARPLKRRIARAPSHPPPGSRFTVHRNRAVATPHGGPHGTCPDTGHPVTRHPARHIPRRGASPRMSRGASRRTARGPAARRPHGEGGAHLLRRSRAHSARGRSRHPVGARRATAGTGPADPPHPFIRTPLPQRPPVNARV